MSLDLDGVNDYAHDAGYTFGDNFTISMWVKTTDNDTSDGFHIWGERKNSGTPQPYFVITTNFRAPSPATADEVGPYISTGQSSANRDYWTNNEPNLFDGTWRNLIFTRDGATTAMYLDGSAITQTYVASDTLPASATITLDKIAFGASWLAGSGTQQFEVDCSLAEYGIWDRTLNANEIALLQTHAPIVIPRGLNDYKPMRGTPVELMNANGLTLVNGAAFVSDHPPVSIVPPMFFGVPAAAAGPGPGPVTRRRPAGVGVSVGFVGLRPVFNRV